MPHRPRQLTLALALLAACGGSSATAPSTSTPPIPPPSTGSFPGFDISVYPGDATMRAWMRPASPYYWSGYYLAAPCHRDPSWTGKYATLNTMGWGFTAIYVGQQDWTQIPAPPPNRAVDPETTPSAAASNALATCSATLLSADQGAGEAADAVQKMLADGFPLQSSVFLDVEFVTTVTTALLEYYRGWIRGVLTDGRYVPGVYAAKSNATTLYNAAVDEFRKAGRTDTPAFWIASSTGFSMNAAPAAVGLNFATAWQGMFDVAQSWASVTLTIDVNVASSGSPSAPRPIVAIADGASPR
jgi:hypothetical protein